MDTSNKEDDMIESAQDQHIRELEDALAATDKLLADIQQRVSALEWYKHLDSIGTSTPASWPTNDPTVDELHDRIAYLENHTAMPDPNDIRVWPWPHTVDDLAQTVIYLRDELAAANAEIRKLTYDRDTLAKRLADICNIAKKDT